MHRLTIVKLGIGALALTGVLMVQAALAQHDEPTCNPEAVIAHQNEHALELANFQEAAETDFEGALETLYRTGIAYQKLALECGFVDQAEVEATHEAEHTDDAALTHTDDEADHLEAAYTVGDPAAGEILFNTLRSEVNFACATCHRVDSTEQLIGPGLLGIGAASHDHSAHSGADATEEAAMPDMQMEITVTPAIQRTLEETIVYLRTAITDPSAYVVPGFPDALMPQTYGEIFTEQEINDLVAYLLTL